MKFINKIYKKDIKIKMNIQWHIQLKKTNFKISKDYKIWNLCDSIFKKY